MQRTRTARQRPLCRESCDVSLQGVNHHLRQYQTNCIATGCVRTYRRISWLTRVKNCPTWQSHPLTMQLCPQIMHSPFKLLTASILSDQVQSLVRALLVAGQCCTEMPTKATRTTLQFVRDWYLTSPRCLLAAARAFDDCSGCISQAHLGSSGSMSR